MTKRLAVIALLAACDSGQATGVDGQSLSTTGQLVTCDKTQTTKVIINTGQTVTAFRYALIDVDPTRYFAIEQCDPLTPPPACDAPACTRTGDVLPPGACTWQTVGGFFGGQLLVGCDTTQTSYDSTGTQVLSTTKTGYATIRVHN